MFCPSCGTKNTVENAKYCSSCGTKLDQDARNATANAKKVTYEDFRRKKEENRSSKFQAGKGGKKAKLDILQDVTIQIGLMICKDGELKLKRGSNLPIKVSPSATKEQLKEKAVEKHSRFNGDVVRSNIPCGYKLLFPDKQPVENMPWKEEEFILKAYKEELGKPYSRITLYLSTNSDYLDHLTSGLFNDDSCDDDLESFDTSSPRTSTITSRPTTSTITSSTSTTTQSTITTGTSTVSTTPSVIEIDVDSTPSTSGTTQCPICFERFCVTEIEDHAEDCSSWLLDSDQPQELKTLNGTADDIPVDIHVPDPSEQKNLLKEQISGLIAGSLTEYTRLSVRRKCLWADFKSARQKKIQPNSNLKIVFVGEPSVDDGGPKRELLSELLTIIQMKFFSDGYPTNSAVALNNEDFKLCGEIMSMSILQGGPAPNFMAPGIANYILGKPLSPSDVKEKNLKTAVDKLENAMSDEEVRDVMTSEVVLDVLEIIGYTSIPQRETTSSVKSIVQSICMKDQLTQYLPSLLQIQSGLNVCGLLEAVRRQPDVWEPVFKSGNTFNITPDEFLDELKVTYSHSQREKDAEIDTFKYFCDVVEKLDRENGNLTLKGLIKWLTGSHQIPPLGFPKKFNVAFIHGCLQGCACRPTASTCDTTIKLPIHIDGEDVMQEMLVSAVLESQGFGLL